MRLSNSDSTEVQRTKTLYVRAPNNRFISASIRTIQLGLQHLAAVPRAYIDPVNNELPFTESGTSMTDTYQLVVDFQEGFYEDTIRILVDAKEVFYQEGITTKTMTGLAESTTLSFSPGKHLMQISIPEKEADIDINIDIKSNLHLGIDYGPDQVLAYQIQQEPFRYM